MRLALVLLLVTACETDNRELRERLDRVERELADLRAVRAKELQDGIELPVPTATEELDRASLVIEISASGQHTVAGKVVLDADLENRFRAAFARDKSTHVIIKAAKGVTHGHVVSVMERAKAAGLTRLAIGTQ